MMVGDHFYVGRSARTNEEGIRQFIEILEGWGLEGSEVPLEEVLHLKTGVNYLEDGNMLCLRRVHREAGFRPVQQGGRARGRGLRRQLHLGQRHRHRARGLPHGAESGARTSATRRWWWTPPNTARWTAACPACRCASKPLLLPNAR